jgi:teichuronic acid exporter
MTRATGVSLATESAPVSAHRAAEMDNLKRAAVRGGSILMGARFLVQLVSWIVTILVARFLMPYDYGVLTSGSILLGLADLLTEAGIGNALIQKQELDDDDVTECFTLSLVLSLAMYAIVLGLSGTASSFFRNADVGGYLRVAGLLLLLIPFRSVPLALLQRRLQMGHQARIQISSASIQAGLTLTLAARGWGFWSLLGGAAAARLLEVGLLARRVNWTPGLRWPRVMGGTVIPFGVHISAASFLWFIYSNADFAVVGRLCGPEALGYYSFAFGLMSLPVQKLTANLNQVSYPIFCRLQHDRGRLKEWYLRLMTLIGLVAVPAMLGMALVADDGIAIVLGSKWSPAVLPFRLLSLVGILMVFGSSLPPLINALGRPDVNMKYAFSCNLVYPAGFWLLGQQYGVTGVCLAWLLIYPVVLCVLLIVTRPITTIGLVDLLKSQAATIGSALLLVAAVLLARMFMTNTQSPLLRLSISIVVGFAAYSGGVFLLARRSVLSELTAIRSGLRRG